MSPNVRRKLAGRFQIHSVGEAGLRLVALDSPPILIVVQTAEPHAPGTPASSSCAGVAVEWREDGAILTLQVAGGPRVVFARSVIIHEPQERLFDALKLPQFDAKSRRFWRRVFALVRIPGGRYLLGALARRAKDRT
jgi:hypothetical protein